MPRDRPLLLALALLSATATAQQIALMQILGWMHWHHFAYLVVAIALLGFGISGTVLSLARNTLLAHWRALLSWLLLATALAIPLGVQLAQHPSLAVDLPLVFFDPAKHTWRLAALCLLLLPPFFFGGLATALVLTACADRAGRFYAASLAGAGLGGLFALALVDHFEPPRLPVLVAIPAFAAFVICGYERERVARSLLIILLPASLLIASLLLPPSLTLSQFKPLSRTLDLPDAHIVASRPSLHGWIQVVDAPALRPAPAVSLNFSGEIPRQPAVFINGLGYGSLLDDDAVSSPEWLTATTDAAAFLNADRRHILLLENGPNGWASFAAAQGATRIDVIEPNGELIALLTDAPQPLAPEWQLPPVHLHHASGRDWLRRSSHTYDVIRFPDVGTLGGTAGLASASEQFLLTREAFSEAWQRLDLSGVIAVTAWMDFPERNPLRLLATLVDAAARAGAEPRDHLVAIRGWATVTFLLRRTPWPDTHLADLRRFCDEHGFDPLLLRNLRPGERQEHHTWQNPNFFRVVDQLVDGPREPLYRNHPFNLRPASDDQPYFSQFLRWSRRTQIAGSFGSQSVPLFELGSLTIALTLVILLLAAVIGIILPLARLGWKDPGKLRVFLYFAGLGAGFMFVEIGLILRAQAWLGSPIQAAAIVITTLLVAAGVGSLYSERVASRRTSQIRALGIILAAVVIAGLLFAILSPHARSWPFALQLTALLAIILPLGASMGAAFPLGLRQLDSDSPAHLPWAWAINGCISVATPAAATLLAISLGFTALLLASAIAYGVALVSTFAAPR